MGNQSSAYHHYQRSKQPPSHQTKATSAALSYHDHHESNNENNNRKKVFLLKSSTRHKDAKGRKLRSHSMPSNPLRVVSYQYKTWTEEGCNISRHLYPELDITASSKHSDVDDSTQLLRTRRHSSLSANRSRNRVMPLSPTTITTSSSVPSSSSISSLFSSNSSMSSTSSSSSIGESNRTRKHPLKRSTKYSHITSTTATTSSSDHQISNLTTQPPVPPNNTKNYHEEGDESTLMYKSLDDSSVFHHHHHHNRTTPSAEHASHEATDKLLPVKNQSKRMVPHPLTLLYSFRHVGETTHPNTSGFPSNIGLNKTL